MDKKILIYMLKSCLPVYLDLYGTLSVLGHMYYTKGENDS